MPAEDDDCDTQTAAPHPSLDSSLPADEGFASSSTPSISLSSAAASDDDGWFSTTGTLSADVVAASASASVASSALGSPESHGPGNGGGPILKKGATGLFPPKTSIFP